MSFNLVANSAIWLTIKRNKTLTLRGESFQKEDSAEQRNKKLRNVLHSCCKVFRSTVICSNMAAYYVTGQ